MTNSKTPQFSTELVERLRSMTPANFTHLGYSAHEAADEIERLRAALKPFAAKAEYVDELQYDDGDYVDSPDNGRVSLLPERPDYCEPREVLLLASYCGDDNDNCTDARPCAECLAMCNVFDERGNFVRELGVSSPVGESRDA